MFRKRLICMMVLTCCLLGIAGGATAKEVECDSVYCFTMEDFAQEEELVGICITGLPEADTGTVMLGSRVLRTGDILTAGQVAQMTFSPLRTETDQTAVVTYLPIFKNRVAPAATATLSIRGKQDNAPVAEDSAVETYKNLPNEGTLKVSDPEGQQLTYSLTRNPRRGSVELRADGTFLYTPKKNKVGVDSFTFTATDPAGNVSREATVTVNILKPSNSTQYTDTVGSSCRFAAEWMKNTGLFVGEQIGGQNCFRENQPVSRGEFITMMVKSLNIPVDEDAAFTGFNDDAPAWLRPYLAAAMRSGLTAGIPLNDQGTLGINDTVTGAEAAVMLQNALDLSVSTNTEEKDENVPQWAATALAAMAENGVSLNAADQLNRGQVAQLLYQVSTLAQEAPGLSMYQ